MYNVILCIQETKEVPTVSEFNGVRIVIIPEKGQKHSSPHFHAYFAGEGICISIETLEVLAATKNFPENIIKIIIEWAREHRSQIKKNWYRIKYHRSVVKI